MDLYNFQAYRAIGIDNIFSRRLSKSEQNIREHVMEWHFLYHVHNITTKTMKTTTTMTIASASKLLLIKVIERVIYEFKFSFVVAKSCFLQFHWIHFERATRFSHKHLQKISMLISISRIQLCFDIFYSPSVLFKLINITALK